MTTETLARTLGQRIAVAGDTLTPTERRVAETILADPTLVAFRTVADLAAMVDTSGPTIVRFANKLGYDGFGELQAQAQRALAAQLKRATDRIRVDGADASVFERAREAATAGVVGVFDAVGEADIAALARPIVGARGDVWVVSSATTSAPAHVLATGLRLVRGRVHHLTRSPATIAAEITDAGPDDVVVAIDFQRYERTVTEVARTLREAGAAVVSITDDALSPLATIADAWVGIGVPAIGPFDSTLPAIALVEALVAQVAHELRDDATARLDRTEALWAAADVFLPEADR